ncbi:MAG: hypothetical protein HYX68_28320 [Planctomycetes bacterium]|nr:hypothetical protein [Planctomycetota bacterium]
MGWLDFFRWSTPTKTPQSALPLATPPTTMVTFDDEAVTCRRADGVVETVRWSDLQIVCIRTTDAGPAVDDVFWVLGGSASGCVVPSEAEGMNLLLERLQHLPGFDNNAAIQAMSCAENHTFLCWKRPGISDSGDN